jgi:hypothetical protein
MKTVKVLLLTHKALKFRKTSSKCPVIKNNDSTNSQPAAGNSIIGDNPNIPLNSNDPPSWSYTGLNRKFLCFQRDGTFLKCLVTCDEKWIFTTMLFERDNGADQGRHQNLLQRKICTPKN